METVNLKLQLLKLNKKICLALIFLISSSYYNSSNSQAQTNFNPKPELLWTALNANRYQYQQQLSPIYDKKALKQLYVTQVADLQRKYKNLNTMIPAHVPHRAKLRVATYNVHGFKDIAGQSNFWAIYNVLADINADVIILQEANQDDIFLKGKLRQRFQKLGYQAATFVGGTRPNSNFGNCIISKYRFACKPYKRNFSRYQNQLHKRAFVKVELDLSAWRQPNFVIYGTHLEVTNAQQRVAEVQELSKLANKFDQRKHVLIAADFNETLHDTALRELGRHNFIDTFAAARLPVPHFTHWSGKPLDYLCLKKNWQQAQRLTITGNYVYYNAASDHLPVITDFNFKP